MKLLLKALYFSLSTLFLLYLIWPGEPDSVTSFSPLPDSVTSDLSGDTIQITGIAAYFSNNYRKFATDFYKNEFNRLVGLPLPFITINHPPEYAYNYIKDQTQSTYLEEYIYPFKSSLFVNGYEPLNEGSLTPRFQGATQIFHKDQKYQTKVTIRYYHSSIGTRLFMWLGITLSIYLLYILIRKVVYSNE